MSTDREQLSLVDFIIITSRFDLSWFQPREGETPEALMQRFIDKRDEVMLTATQDEVLLAEYIQAIVLDGQPDGRVPEEARKMLLADDEELHQA